MNKLNITMNSLPLNDFSTTQCKHLVTSKDTLSQALNFTPVGIAYPTVNTPQITIIEYGYRPYN